MSIFIQELINGVGSFSRKSKPLDDSPDVLWVLYVAVVEGIEADPEWSGACVLTGVWSQFSRER